MANVDASSSGTETVSSKENSAVRWLLLLTFVSVPLANYIIPRILTDGNQFADDPPTRVAAAGYAFAIWGVIFTGMLWFSLAMCFGREPQTKSLKSAMICLIIAGIASIVFVPMSIYLSNTIVFIDIMAHLIPLAFAAMYLRKHVVATSLIPGYEPKWFVRGSFFGPSMYFGWITAATVISTSLMAADLEIRLEENVATILAIATLVCVSLIAFVILFKADVVYAGTIAWALVAVGVKQAAFPTIRYVAWTAAAVLVAAIVISVVTRRPLFYPSGKSLLKTP